MNFEEVFEVSARCLAPKQAMEKLVEMAAEGALAHSQPVMVTHERTRQALSNKSLDQIARGREQWEAFKQALEKARDLAPPSLSEMLRA